MSLYKEIKNFGNYFNSIRIHENLLIVDLILPSNWEDEKILRQTTIKDGENTVQLKVNKRGDNSKAVSFYSIFDENGTSSLVTEIKKVIKWNKDLEEKNRLLEEKIIEMKKIFIENNIDSLRNLKIDFDDIKFKLNGREEFEPVASEGNSEGPEGNTTRWSKWYI